MVTTLSRLWHSLHGMRGTLTLSAAVTAFTMLLPAQAVGQDIGLPVGSTPGAAVVEDLDGAAVDLASIVGTRPVLLEFWATWCPLCEELEPQIRAITRRYGNDVEVIVVAVGVNQNPRSIRRHLQRHDVPGRVLFDARGAATRAYRAPTTSYVVLLDASGRVAYTGQGGDQDLVGAVQRVIGSR